MSEMNGKEKKKRPLSKKEYSVLVSCVCLTAGVLIGFGIAVYKVVHIILRSM